MNFTNYETGLEVWLIDSNIDHICIHSVYDFLIKVVTKKNNVFD